MGKRKGELPHITRVLEVLGLREQSELAKALEPISGPPPTKLNFRRACRILKITVCQLRKVLAQGEKHTIPKRKTKDMKNINIDAIKAITSDKTLREMVSMSMKARALWINQVYQTNMSAYQLRKIYKGNNIKRKLMQSRLGKPVLPHQTIQMEMLKVAKDRYKQLKDAGYHVVQVDECLFNSDSYQGRYWTN